jgi:hypothetical protein
MIHKDVRSVQPRVRTLSKNINDTQWINFTVELVFYTRNKVLYQSCSVLTQEYLFL